LYLHLFITAGHCFLSTPWLRQPTCMSTWKLTLKLSALFFAQLTRSSTLLREPVRTLTQTVTHHSTNRTRRRVTSLTALPLNKTATHAPSQPQFWRRKFWGKPAKNKFGDSYPLSVAMFLPIPHICSLPDNVRSYQKYAIFI